MKRNLVLEEFLIAGLASLIPSLGELIRESDHPVAQRVREIRPAEWETERAEREIAERAK